MRPFVIGISMGVLFTAPILSARAADYEFSDVTSVAGVATEFAPRHWAGSWADYDNDGRLDLYVANGSANNLATPDGANTLYRNNGDGTFTDVTGQTGTGDIYPAMRNVWADYDNDGDLDLYSHNFNQSTLYQNNGNVFTDVNASSGAGVAMPNGTGAAWGDYDNDGLLDLHLNALPGQNVLFHNNGDGTFTNLQGSAGLPLGTASMAQAWGDYDNDGFQDLASAAVTPIDQSVLYRNNTNGTFTDVTIQAGIILEPGASLAPVAWGDYNNDGWLDLVVSEVTIGSEKTLPNRIYLFRNKGDGTFEDVTLAAGLTAPPEPIDFWDAAWADFDNDGDFDLYISVAGPNLIISE